MKTLMNMIATKASGVVILIRLMVGSVFLSEGIQKFMFPDLRGVGRFEKIGIPSPEFLAYFVGTFEVICGVLIVTGLLTRFAVIPTIIIMLVAIATTKIPMLSNEGFWEMAHAARTDFSMLLGSLYLLIVGAGQWSVDNLIIALRKMRDVATVNSAQE